MTTAVSKVDESPAGRASPRAAARLDVFIGKWINERQTVPTTDAPSVKNLTSEIYKWSAGRCFVVRNAYRRIGDTHGGGTEDRLRRSHRWLPHPLLQFQGRHRRRDACRAGRLLDVEGERTRCTERGRVDRALHHEWTDDGEHWRPSMDVTLTQDRMTASATRRHEEPTIMDPGTPTMSLSEHRSALSLDGWGGSSCR